MFTSKYNGSRAAITQSGSQKACRKPLGENLLDGMMSRKRAWLLYTVLNGDNDVEFWISLKTSFIRKTYTLEAETSESG